MNAYTRSPMLLGIGGLAAGVATIVTIGVTVLLPMQATPTQNIANAPTTRVPVEVAARYRIEVIASRKANAA